MRGRDYSLDFIKGMACILMILAHVPAIVPMNAIYKGTMIGNIIGILFSIGGFAPILFFAVSGVTSQFQAKKNVRALVVFYIIFAILGFSYNAIWRPNIYSYSFDVPQIIALSVIVTILFEAYIKPNKVFYLISSILVFFIHFFISKNIGPFPLKFIFFVPSIFPLFPWLSMFFFGIFLYRINKKFNLVVGVLLIVSFYLGIRYGNFGYLNKFDMSMGYFCLSLIVMSLIFYIGRVIKFKRLNNPILYFGKNSLLFLYVHLFITVILSRLSDNIILLWFVVLILSYPLMRLIEFLNGYIERYFNNYKVWVFITIAVCLIPLINNIYIVFFTEIFMGMLFSVNYPKLLKILQSEVFNRSVKI